jgi:hypothetical protein
MRENIYIHIRFQPFLTILLAAEIIFYGALYSFDIFSNFLKLAHASAFSKLILAHLKI